MEQPLDLSITLTAPPQGSGPDAIARTSIQCDALGLSPIGGLLYDPLTQQEHNNLLWYLEEYWKWPYEQFLERGKKVEAFLVELGKRLYNAMCGNAEAMSVVQAWQSYPLQPGEQRQISIVSELPRALSLPWELLHDEQGFLALRPDYPISIVRRLLPSDWSALTTSFEPPLRILLVTARPEGAGFIDPRSIARELLDEVQDYVVDGTIELEFLRPPTVSALSTRLEDIQRPIHVLHFDGHGAFRQRERQGMLAFEDNHGKIDLVTAAKLAQILRNSKVRLVVLTACQSAATAADDAFSSAAAQLLQSGIDAVVAMSASFLVTSAVRYVQAYYRAVAASIPVPVAQERARYDLYVDPRRHLLRRRREEEGTPVALYDWWVPHFYQQRPVLLQATKERHIDEKPTETFPIRRLNEEMPVEPRYGFRGRARELLRIERSLMRGKVMIIHGFGGVGKTALVRETADWLTRTRMYDGSCFVSFEHGGDATTLLSALGTYLGVYDANYNPNNKEVAFVHLQPALKKCSTLIVADNLESILPGGEAPLDPVVRTRLWDTLLELAKMGAGVLLTSRGTAFGDGRLEHGERVACLELKGLHPDDAYALATRLLDDLGIDRARAPYPELRDLLHRLDHHPLAIQLVLPSLQTLPLANIQANFEEHLVKFADDSERGHNRSLLASLDYSLQRLSEEQRLLITRLAPFEGGVTENNLLEITNIAETDWARLRVALEHAALLTVEQIHQSIPYPFLHFHPVLAPFLRGQLSEEDEALLQRYASHYSMFSSYLYQQDKHHAQAVRSWFLKELPNLRRALNMLLEKDEREIAPGMASEIARFLSNFGLERERDALWQHLAESRVEVDTRADSALSEGEYSLESGLAQYYYRKGDLDSAFERFTALLARLEASPAGMSLDNASYEHAQVLDGLARCHTGKAEYSAAENRVNQALAIIDDLLRLEPDNQQYIHERGVFLTDLSGVLLHQEKFSAARQAAEEALRIAQQQGDLRQQSVVFLELGIVAMTQERYPEAQYYFRAVLEVGRVLGEPTMESNAWVNLSQLARKQEDWVEAENCLRESLQLQEQFGGAAIVAGICFELGLVAIATDRFSEGEGWFQRALAIQEQVLGPQHPDVAFSLSRLAMIYHFQGKDTQAEHFYTRALAIQEQALNPQHPGLVSTLQGLALLYRSRGKDAQAVPLLLRVHAIQERALGSEHPDVASTLNSLAQAYLSRGLMYEGLQQHDKALSDYSLAIELDPTFAEAYLVRGMLYRELHRDNEALADYAQAVKLDPSLWRAYLLRGTIFANRNRYHDALADFTQAIQLNPSFALAYSGRGRVYHGLQRYEEALGDFTRAIQLDSSLAEAYALRGDIHYLLKQFDEALIDHSRFIELEADDDEGYRHRSATYRAMGHYQEALADIDQAIRLAPANAANYTNRGALYNDLEQYQSALVDLNRAIELDPTDTKAFNNRAIASLNLQRKDDALGDFNHAIELDSTYALAYHNACGLYIQKGLLLEAFPYFVKAAQLGIPTAYYSAELREEFGAIELAFEAFQAAHQIKNMRQTVKRFPSLITPDFLSFIERMIALQTSPDLKAHLKQQLAWLQQIANKHK